MTQAALRQAMGLGCSLLVSKGQVPPDIARKFVDLTVGCAWAHGLTGMSCAAAVRHACWEALTRYGDEEFWEVLAKQRFYDGGTYREGLLACINRAIEEHLTLVGPDSDPAPDTECPIDADLLLLFRMALEIPISLVLVPMHRRRPEGPGSVPPG